MNNRIQQNAQSNLDIVKAFLAAEQRGDFSIYETFLSDDVEYTVIGSTTHTTGKTAFVNKVKANYRELPDWRFDIISEAALGDTVILEFDGCGHFTGTDNGKQYTNVPLRLKAFEVFRLRGGKIYFMREYFDAVGYQRQLAESQ